MGWQAFLFCSPLLYQISLKLFSHPCRDLWNHDRVEETVPIVSDRWSQVVISLRIIEGVALSRHVCKTIVNCVDSDHRYGK
jgi:hypothetical protein